MDEINIPFEPEWENVAIAVSGGADSALLTYLICKKISGNTKVHIINNIRCWKTKPWQQQDIKNVVEWLQSYFPHINFVIHKNFVAPELEWSNIGPSIVDEYGKLVSGDNLELRAFAEYVCVTNQINAYYNAVTRNPRNVDFVGMPSRDIEVTESNSHLLIMNHMGILACHPFRFIEKSKIVQEYRRNNILDLFKITRSCEGEFKNINYKTYTPGQYVPVCGECFWCKEREWAIEQSK
jgi:7-cyano-7-deazaguanine synthase in queuosine biosynthesis